MRIIKFRAWMPNSNIFMYWGLGDINGDMAYFTGPPNDVFATHQQYTGLKDKNGEEIYEGDILQPEVYLKSTFMRRAIIFKNGYFALDGNHCPLWASMKASVSANNVYVVIGNICESPELLKDNK